MDTAAVALAPAGLVAGAALATPFDFAAGLVSLVVLLDGLVFGVVPWGALLTGAADAGEP